MSNIVFHIDASAISGHTARIERISGALQSSVRQTLNRAALRAKQVTIPAETDKVFAKRRATFIKSSTTVNFAKGNDMNNMVAAVGFLPKLNDSSHSVEDLDKQEYGGDIANKAFIPLAQARTSRSWKKLVMGEFKMSEVNSRGIIDALKTRGKNKRQQFVIAAIYAKKFGFFELGTDRKNGARKLLNINSVKKDGTNTLVNSTAIYNVKAKRKVHTNSTFRHFMLRACVAAQKDMEKDFKEIVENKLAGIR